MAICGDALDTLEEAEESTRADLLPSMNSGAFGFVVLWSHDEPDHMGAWMPFEPGTQLLGRGPAHCADPHPRLLPDRQLPDGHQHLAAFRSSSLSRTQLLIRATVPSAFELVNVGRLRLAVNGTQLERDVLREGDIVELGNQLSLFCTRRPHRLDFTLTGREHAFGRADADGIVGESPAAWRLRKAIAFAAPRRGHVLVCGETGTGKELVARALHEAHAGSNRAAPLIARNAATLPEGLVDAELFGNAKGYPNPGMPERRGLIGAANGGTLFLDEFAELPLAAQAHILRVLDGGEYHRLGEDTARRSSFRLIAATNRPDSLLRTDIVARFDFRIRTPSLQERLEDIPLLACHLFRKIAEEEPDLGQRFRSQSGLPRLGPGFLVRLLRHPYTGNVRELRYLLWRAMSSSSGHTLHWPDRLADDETRAVSAVPATPAPAAQADARLAPAELQRALDANNGSIEKTWRALGLANRHALVRLVRKHELAITKRTS